ncbi:MAG: hypothetical protein ABFC77_14355 [Thermoguttaceae bacterium]
MLGQSIVREEPAKEQEMGLLIRYYWRRVKRQVAAKVTAMFRGSH